MLIATQDGCFYLVQPKQAQSELNRHVLLICTNNPALLETIRWQWGQAIPVERLGPDEFPYSLQVDQSKARQIVYQMIHNIDYSSLPNAVASQPKLGPTTYLGLLVKLFELFIRYAPTFK